MLNVGRNHRSNAMPMAPPIMATASAPRLRLFMLSAPFCNFGELEVLAADEVADAVCSSTTANEVIVVNEPSDSEVVSKTKLWTTPPPGVYVVTKVLPLASVAMRVAPDTALVKTTEFPPLSVVEIV